MVTLHNSIPNCSRTMPSRVKKGKTLSDLALVFSCLLPHCCTFCDRPLGVMRTGLTHDQDSFLVIRGLSQLWRPVMCDLCSRTHSHRWTTSSSLASRWTVFVAAATFVSTIHNNQRASERQQTIALSLPCSSTLTDGDNEEW